MNINNFIYKSSARWDVTRGTIWEFDDEEAGWQEEFWSKPFKIWYEAYEDVEDIELVEVRAEKPVKNELPSSYHKGDLTLLLGLEGLSD